MKLVVDIPDGMYDFLMEHTDRQFPYATEWIRQGAPYEECKTGEWVHVNSNSFKCSVCGNFLDFHGVNAGRGDANYCPNCGAKMKVDE